MLTLIKNANVFSPEPLGIRHVLVAGDRIVHIGTEVPELDARLGVDVVDAGGARLIPGFIDPHAHVTGGGGEAGFETSVPAPLLSEYTRAGVEFVLAADCVGYERELGPMGVPRLLADEFRRHGREIPMYASELEAVHAALYIIQPGDTVLLLVKGQRTETLAAIRSAEDPTGLS